jgi:hypothetical protein
MYLIKALSAFLISSICFGSELHVQAFNVQYRLDFTNNLVKLKGNQIDLVIKKKKCNKLSIKDFNHRLNKKLNSSLKRTNKQKSDFNYRIDSDLYYENKNSSFGVFLIKLPNAIKKLSIQNSILCDSSKKK